MAKQRDLARRITEERHTIQTRLARMARRTTNGLSENQELPNGHPGDVLEQAQHECLKEQESRAYEFLASRAQALDRAWESLQQGTYGVCRLCEKPIPQRRLEAVPTATFCVSCQELLE